MTEGQYHGPIGRYGTGPEAVPADSPDAPYCDICGHAHYPYCGDEPLEEEQ